MQVTSSKTAMQSAERRHIIHTTRSLCPLCLRVLEAQIVEQAGKVYMLKTCPADGPFEVYLWPSVAHYNWFRTFNFPADRPTPQTPAREGCPRDCGACPSHARRPVMVEIEVTHRCNLACPVCFASADQNSPDPSLDTIAKVLRTTLSQAPLTTNLQLTGGEPTIRPDLPQIVRCARELGFRGIELNTNGITIARRPAYLRALKDSGLTGIYLQFDGLQPQVSVRLRNCDLLHTKLRAIENCRAERVPVALAATVIGGVNDHELGGMLDFALENLDVICGLSFQPGFESGRFDIYPECRLTMGDVVSLLVAQSRGRLAVQDFWPLGCSHPLCSSGTHLFRNGDTMSPVTRNLTMTEYRSLFNRSSPQGAVFADIQALRQRRDPNHATSRRERGLSILIMNLMDSWTIDLDRLQECSMTVATPGGSIIPFCAYHLTDRVRQRIYPYENGTANQLSRGRRRAEA